jgi:pilus assembly protein Flp/PilA
MKTLLARFARDNAGATAVEYGLIAALIGVAIVAGASALGGTIDGLFTSMASPMETTSSN